MSCYKLLVEQGDPFSQGTLNIKSLRWLISAVCLAALVISNAYKRENMLKMIQPRGKIPYESFSQLVQHSFEIYTRASRITHVIDQKCNENDRSQCTRKNLTMVNPHFYTNFYVRLRSDVFQLKESKSPFFDFLYKYSKIVPETISEKVDYSISELLMRQNKAIENKLLTCKKQAAIVPEIVAAEMETILKQKYPKDQVYVGKDILFQSGLYFGFDNLYSDNSPVPSKIIVNRYAGYKEAGFLTNWKNGMDFLARIRGQRGNYTKTLETTRASLSGNISVIFVVLAVGILFSIAGFIFERYLFHLVSNPKQTVFQLGRLIVRIKLRFS